MVAQLWVAMFGGARHPQLPPVTPLVLPGASDWPQMILINKLTIGVMIVQLNVTLLHCDGGRVCYVSYNQIMNIILYCDGNIV